MIDLTNPNVRDLFREILEAQYLAKLIKQLRLRSPVPPIKLPPGAQPDPPPFRSLDLHQVLLGDLLISAIGDPEPAPNKLSLAHLIRESNLHVEVVSDLLDQFREGAELLEAELKQFQSQTER